MGDIDSWDKFLDDGLEPTYQSNIFRYVLGQELKSKCLKQCKVKSSALDITEIEQEPFHPIGDVQVSLFLIVTPEQVFHKEYLVYDDIGMIGSIGGSLGLFVGFSMYDTLCMIVDLVLKKFKFT